LRAAAPLAAALLLTACDGGGEGGAGGPVPAAAIPDPATLERASSPNDALVCPARACAAETDRAAPTYPVSPDALFAAWREVVVAAPRAELVASDPARRLLLARQRSRFLGFADTVTVRVVPMPQGSSFAAHSRSEVGWYDFGVNEARLEVWQAQAEDRLGPAAGAR
jgi:uncharacterized protein (DUF1499 family)